MNQRGFSLTEVMVTVVVIGILANAALPAYHRAQTDAQAASILADFHAVRSAAFDYYADHNRFPRSGRWGQAPRELISYPPKAVQFKTPETRYRWLSFSFGSRTVLVLQLQSSDKDLLAAVKSIYGGSSFLTSHVVTLYSWV